MGPADVVGGAYAFGRDDCALLWSPIVSDGSAWRIHLKRESVSKLIE